jgi:leader peptidase (prepilin peptidase)/N-methyltransferase
MRYDYDGSLSKNIHGRSHCPYCKKTLNWYELVPIMSFLLQLGRCRSCRKPLSLQYPILEILGGLFFVFVPMSFMPINQIIPIPYPLIIIWVLAFLTLILISAIDFRLQIIPDNLNLFIGLLGVAAFIYRYYENGFGLTNIGVQGSFLGHYALMFWVYNNSLLVNTLLGFVFGGVLLGGLYFITGGRGMGFGDVKLAIAAGLLMGWPDIALALILAFIIGAILSVGLMIIKRKGRKDYLPFGPFIALGITLVFFFGYDIANAYFKFFSNIY